MDTIRVNSAFAEATYPSIDEAIVGASANTPRFQRAQHDSQRLKGHVIEKVSCTERTLSLHLSSKVRLTFSAENGIVDWSLQEANNSSPAEQGYPQPVLLLFSQSQDSYRWDRAGILRRRINHEVQMIFAGETCVYFYVEGCATMLLLCLTVEDTGEDLLYWDDSD
jgi:hypothetical protein